MDTTSKIIANLTARASRQQLRDGEALYGLLKEEMAEILSQVEQPLVIDTEKKPYVILMVGVNGVGKTTTIGKLAKQFQAQGKKVMLAAGDTFRAAAVEQLQVWESAIKCLSSLSILAPTVPPSFMMRLKRRKRAGLTW